MEFLSKLNFKSVIQWVLSPLIAFASSYFLSGTFYDNSSKKITANDFSVVKTIASKDSTSQISNFFIQNISNRPINPQNCLLTFKSNCLPQKVFLISSNGIARSLPFGKDKREIFKMPLPEKLKDEEWFILNVIYNSLNPIDDNLQVKVESKTEPEFMNYGESNVQLNNLIKDFKSTQSLTKSVIVGETVLFLWFIFFHICNWIYKIMESKKQDDENNYTGDSENKFITAQ